MCIRKYRPSTNRVTAVSKPVDTSRTPAQVTNAFQDRNSRSMATAPGNAIKLCLVKPARQNSNAETPTRIWIAHVKVQTRGGQSFSQQLGIVHSYAVRSQKRDANSV